MDTFITSFSEYINDISRAFDDLAYHEIQYRADENARLLIPFLNNGPRIILNESQVMGNLFRDFKDYGCDVERRVLSSWTCGMIADIPFGDQEKENFQSRYSERENVINEIKRSRGIECSNDPLWGVIIISHDIPLLFHCQLRIEDKNNLDTENLCLSLCREYDSLSSYNRYPLPDSEAIICKKKEDFDWFMLHSLWWNSEDNAFIQYSRNVICKWQAQLVKEELARMQKHYIEKAVSEYDSHRKVMTSLNPEIELGIINEAIARYDWSTHTMMLMESHKRQFVKDRKAKERIPAEESFFRTVQDFCKDVRLDYDGKEKPRFQGQGWSSKTLKELYDYLIVSKNISPNTAFLDFVYYFGGEVYKVMKEPDSRIEWIGNEGGLYLALLEEFKDERYIECSGKKRKEEYEKNKDSQISWKKVEQILVISGDSKLHIGCKRKPNVKRTNDSKKDNPYERYKKILDKLKGGTPHKALYTPIKKD